MQTLKVDMTNSENEAWTKKETNEDAIFTLNVEETVVGIKQNYSCNSEKDSVYPVTRKTTRSHKVSIILTSEI